VGRKANKKRARRWLRKEGARQIRKTRGTNDTPSDRILAQVFGVSR
jgi:hypothetical protein